MRTRIAASALAAAALAGTVAACGGGESADGKSGGSTPKADTVSIKTFQFAPGTLTVPSGTTVTFRNQDAIRHTVTSGTRSGESTDTPDDRFDLDLRRAGATGSERFTEPGRYAYYCKLHPGSGMTGAIVVK